MRNMITEGTTRSRFFYLFFVTILISVSGALQTGCEDNRIHVTVENYLGFLGITPEEEPEIEALLAELHDIVEEYNKKLDEGAEESHRERYKSNNLLKLRINLLESLNPLMVEIYEKLDDRQRSTWIRTELYYFYLNTRKYVINHYSATLDFASDRRVTPGALQEPKKGFPPEKPIEQWTIYFGLPMYSFSANNTRKSIPKAARGSFPISIQATLMDKTVLEGERDLTESYPPDFAPESVIEVRVLLSTRLHPNYIDIDNWIPFLELPGGVEVEPMKIIKRDENWFEKRGLLLSSRIPKFLSSPESAGEAPGRRINAARGGLFTRYNEYYQLFFPAFINNRALISPETAYIDLVFLEEIGSVNRAEGTWRFNWSNK